MINSFENFHQINYDNDEIFIVTDGKTYSSRDIYEIMCSTLDKRIPRWFVPQFLFNVIASISSHLRYRID